MFVPYMLQLSLLIWKGKEKKGLIGKGKSYKAILISAQQSLNSFQATTCQQEKWTLTHTITQ